MQSTLCDRYSKSHDDIRTHSIGLSLPPQTKSYALIYTLPLMLTHLINGQTEIFYPSSNSHDNQ